MATVEITGLAEAVVSWGIDQAVGTKIGNEITPLLNPLIVAIAGGASIPNALISVALTELESKLPAGVGAELGTVITTVLTDLETGKTLKQALTDVLVGLV